MLHEDPKFAGLENQLSTCIFRELCEDSEHLFIFSHTDISISNVRGKGSVFIVIRARI